MRLAFFRLIPLVLRLGFAYQHAAPLPNTVHRKWSREGMQPFSYPAQIARIVFGVRVASQIPAEAEPRP